MSFLAATAPLATATSPTVPLPPGRWYIGSDMGIIPVYDHYNESMEKAMQQGVPTTSISINNTTYTVRFDATDRSRAIQCNDTTSCERYLIRLNKSDYVWEYESDGDSMNDSDDSDDDNSTNPSTSKFSPCYSSELMEWEYNKKPRQRFIVITLPYEHKLLIDFQKMTQENLETNRVRTLRRHRAENEPLLWKILTSAAEIKDDTTCAICLHEKHPSREPVPATNPHWQQIRTLVINPLNKLYK
mmetsp:Transcript_8680/g.10686  ORF Transcript_8680/g.10686 Transcript_8680/m.10686 type:complete len:244 (+) Transcript_8680:125-856(+)